MPLSELTPQFPALADEVVKLATELQQSGAGEELLRSLSDAAVQGGALASDIYTSLSTANNN